MKCRSSASRTSSSGRAAWTTRSSGRSWASCSTARPNSWRRTRRRRTSRCRPRSVRQPRPCIPARSRSTVLVVCSRVSRGSYLPFGGGGTTPCNRPPQRATACGFAVSHAPAAGPAARVASTGAPRSARSRTPVTSGLAGEHRVGLHLRRGSGGQVVADRTRAVTDAAVAGGAERGAPRGAQPHSRGKRLCRRAPRGAVRRQDPRPTGAVSAQTGFAVGTPRAGR